MMVLKMGGKISCVPKVRWHDHTETTNNLSSDPVARKPKYFHSLLFSFLFATILTSVADVPASESLSIFGSI